MTREEAESIVAAYTVGANYPKDKLIEAVLKLEEIDNE